MSTQNTNIIKKKYLNFRFFDSNADVAPFNAIEIDMKSTEFQNGGFKI